MPGFVNVAKLSEIAPGQLRFVRSAGGATACLANVGGKIYAVAGECPHERGVLADGTLEGEILICPLHGSMFDVTTGEVQGPPADDGLATYEVRVQGDDIQVAID
jgi:3-phenylpropionate/trans-cinnamate dioxygenase ferredoxin subunit/naphthalene 1,2-dioxygenase system ferredoxin subunit